MRYQPCADNIIASIVDLKESKGGLVLPTNSGRNVTMLARVESVGPEVKRCKAGDVVVYHRCNFIVLRDGTQRITFLDSEVLCTVEGLDENRVEKQVGKGGGTHEVSSAV